MFPEEAFRLTQKEAITPKVIEDTESKIDIETKKDESIKLEAKEPTQPKKKIQKKKNRCWICRKKLSLAAQFKCKCGMICTCVHVFGDMVIYNVFV